LNDEDIKSSPEDIVDSEIEALILDFIKSDENTATNVRVFRPTVKNLLFSGSLAGIMADLEDSDGNRESVNPQLRWIHLPANNMSWIRVNERFAIESFTLLMYD
jgi:hypothetical protein